MPVPRAFRVPLHLPERSATSLIDEQIDQIFANAEVSEYLAKCSRTILGNADGQRVQFLNQEITDLRAQLDIAEDWDAYERTSLKYHIILYEEERDRMAREAHTRALRDLRAREMRADRFDLIHEDIAWSEESISCLREKLKKAAPEERSAIFAQIKTYTDHVRKLLAQSARVATDPSVEWMAEPELDLSSEATATQELFEPPHRPAERVHFETAPRAAVRHPGGSKRARTRRKPGRRRRTHCGCKGAARARSVNLVLELMSLLGSLATSK